MTTDHRSADVRRAKVVEGSDGLLLEIDGQIVPNYDATFTPFEEGDVVTGLVVRIDNDEVLVDIGYKSEGVIPSNELSIRKTVDPHDEVEMGEEVDALVLTKEDQDGRLIMSKKRARFEKAWRRIEAAAESGEPVEGTVIEVVKGGLIIDLGVRGFLPASLVDIRRVPNLDEYMGTKIECKVIELNRSRNNVVLSRRAVLEEERKEQRQEILDRLQPGLVVEGQISNIVDFGAFVDLNGIDGLIHISELSWSHVNHPSEILSIGDTVQVKVLDIDRDRQRISLGLKQTQEDPWQRVVDTYNVGDELEGTVTKVVTFGAFVEILDGVEGLVHISELAAAPRREPARGRPAGRRRARSRSSRSTPSAAACRCRSSASRARSCRAAVRRRGGGRGAGDLDDVPELGLSEDVFADGRRGRGAAAEARRRPRAEPRTPRPSAEVAAEAAEPPRPSEAPPRPRPPSRAPRPSRAGRGRARAAAPTRPSRPPRSAPTSRAPTPSRTSRPEAARRRVPFVGLTGGLGAGKSTALAALERLGAATLSTDAVVHELYATRRGARRGRRALGRRGRARRASSTAPRSRARAFADPSERAWLEGLLWPRVGARVAAWRDEVARRDPPPRAAVVETPLLFEAGHGRRLRRDDRRRRRRGGARASARPRAGTRRSTSAPRASSRRRRRRRARRTSSATTGPWRSSSVELSAVLAKLSAA